MAYGHINQAFRHEAEDTQSRSSRRDEDDDTLPSPESDVEQGRFRHSDTHSIVLDMSTTSFVDTVTVKTLKNVGSPLMFLHRAAAVTVGQCGYPTGNQLESQEPQSILVMKSIHPSHHLN